LKRKENFICNSPIVVSKLYENGRVEYLTKIDDEFNVRVNNNLAKNMRFFLVKNIQVME